MKMTDEEFDWATLKQIARVFRACKGFNPAGWEPLMQHASYAAALSESLSMGQAAEHDRERRDRLSDIAKAFLDVAIAQGRPGNPEQDKAWEDLESLLSEEGAWLAARVTH